MKKFMEFLAMGVMLALCVVILIGVIPFLGDNKKLQTTQEITLEEDGGYTVMKRVTRSTETDTACVYMWFRATKGNTIFPECQDGSMSTITCADRNGDGAFEHMYIIFAEGTTSGLMFIGNDQNDPESWICGFPNGDPDKILTDQEKKHFVQMLNETNAKM